MTLKSVYAEWLPQKSRQVKSSSIAAYKLMWNSHIEKRWGDVELSEINKRTVRAWIYEKIDSGLSTKTVHDINILFRQLLKYAAEEMELNVPSMAWNIVWPTKNKEGINKLETYPSNVVQKVLSKCKEAPEPRKIALMIAFCTGMRIGEVCGLQWDDVDLQDKVFHVRRTVERIYDTQMRHTVVQCGTTKTVSGTRSIPIAKDLLPLLKAAKGFYIGSYYVASCKEKPEEPRVYRNWTCQFLKSIGVNKILKFHAIRHTFATTMIEQGVDVKTVATILGHADVSTTLSVYCHPSDESKAKAVNKVIGKMF